MMLYLFILLTSLVRMEDGFCEAARLEQREAQNDCVRRNREESRVNICGNDHVVDQHSIDADANHDEEALESQSEQALEVVRSNAAPFAVAHRCDGNWCNADGAINLNHSAVEDDRNENGHDFEAQTDNQCFDGQSEQFSDAHCLHACSHCVKGCLNVDVGSALNKTGCTGNHILSDVEYCQHNVKGVGHKVDRHSRFEEPLEEHPCVHVVQVVLFGDHGDQLITQDKGNDDTSDGDYHILG